MRENINDRWWETEIHKIMKIKENYIANYITLLKRVYSYKNKKDWHIKFKIRKLLWWPIYNMPINKLSWIKESKEEPMLSKGVRNMLTSEFSRKAENK